MAHTEITPAGGPARKKYVRAIGPRLRLLLYFIFGLVAILASNSVYLSAITFLEWLKTDPNTTYQNWFYMVMFGTHLGLGLLIVLPSSSSAFFTSSMHMTARTAAPSRSATCFFSRHWPSWSPACC